MVFRSLCSDVGDLSDGAVVAALAIPIESDSLVFNDAEPTLGFVVFACFRMQSSLQYTEFKRDGWMPHTMQFDTVESDLDGIDERSLIRIDGLSVGNFRGKMF